MLRSICFSLLLTGSLQASLLQVDFQNDTPGQAPAGATVSGLTTNVNRVFVVDNASTPADPFAPSGNKSLMIEKSATGNIPRVSWSLNDQAAGTLTFTAYSANTTGFTNPFFRLYLYEGSSIGVAIGWTGQTFNVVTRDESGTTTRNFSDVWTSNAAHEISITFGDGHYSLQIDGTPLEYEGNPNFAYRDTISTGFTRLEFAIASSSNAGSRIFIDDLELAAIPEPSTLGLLLTGGALGLGALRRPLCRYLKP